MKVVHFAEIRDEIIRNMKRQMLLPVIGSGFTKGCHSQSGKVPSGEEYKRHMVDAVASEKNLTPIEIESLLSDSFSEVSAIYQATVSIKVQNEYLKKHFTSVRIDNNNNLDFLKIEWPYVYTINIDDGIERNSQFTRVIYSNRVFNPEIFNDGRCVVKLHGDITEVLTYYDAVSEVLSQEQYIKSLKLNIPLLNKLNHDSQFMNLLFIGCSLDDEIDLLVYARKNSGIGNVSAHYICMIADPGVLQKLKLERYGISHIVLFDSYDDMYHNLYEAWLESERITTDELESYKSFKIDKLNCDYDLNRSYLLHGKGLIKKDRTITLPFYFISRDIVEGILNSLQSCPIQIIVGGGSSGKTYLMIDLAARIKSKDVFLFESKDRISSSALRSLVDKKNCVILIDSSSFTTEQIELLIKKREYFKSNGVSIVILSRKNNRDLISLISLLEYKEEIPKDSLLPISLSNKFSNVELDIINPLLISIGAGIFSFSNATIIDNLIYMCSKLKDNNKFSSLKPSYASDRSIAVLIILAIKKKIYSRQAIEYDILQELYDQVKRISPLIEQEATWSFEKDALDNSPEKWVLNADYWLSNELGDYSNSIANRQKLVRAYKYIVSKAIEIEGKPDFTGRKDYLYKDYILFDNINEIFYRQGKGNIFLIREIYESLNELLSLDPHYMHQRTKCYIRSAFLEYDPELKDEFLDRAFRDANIAEQVFQKRYHESKNEKILISIAHVNFSQAIIACFECYRLNYSNVEKNDVAIEKIYIALLTPYNEKEYLREEGRDHKKPINNLVFTCFADKTLISIHSFSHLEFIVNKIRELQQ